AEQLMPAIAVPNSKGPPLEITLLGENQGCVLKNSETGAYFQLGAEEHFLLTQLECNRSQVEICNAFLDRFGKPFREQDIVDFAEQARSEGLFLQAVRRSDSGQSLLYWRKKLFDPDRLLGWLAPRLTLFWTPVFAVVSAACILCAGFILWSNRSDLASSLA